MALPNRSQTRATRLEMRGCGTLLDIRTILVLGAPFPRELRVLAIAAGETLLVRNF
jgi:hypothetical protein